MLKKFFRYLLLLASLIIAVGCSQSLRFGNSSNYPSDKSTNNFTVNNSTPNTESVFTGKASYYADKFHGRYTASGEVFDMNKLTAAHRTLMFGTSVKVTNLWNNKSVIVRINDRGPFKGDRVIDLSKAAARQIDMLAAGVVDVKVEVLD